MTDDDTYELSVCVDCIILLANGETPPDMDEQETDRWIENIAHRWNGYYVAPGDDDNGFSMDSCDHCGSRLGGDRFQAFAWLSNNT